MTEKINTKITQLEVDVLVISVFGRAHALAGKLKRKGLSVSLLDCSHLFAPTFYEEWSGPFPLLTSTTWDRDSLFFFESFGELKENRLSILSQQGPLEFYWDYSKWSGLHTNYDKNVIQYLQKFSEWTKDKQKKMFKRLQTVPFEKYWPLELFHNLTRTQLDINCRREIPDTLISCFKSPIQIFDSTHDVKQRLKNYATIYNINTLENCNIINLEFQKKFIKAKTTQGDIKARYLVWCLEGFETISLFPKFANQIFKKIENPWWVWKSFYLDTSNTPSETDQNTSDALPVFFVSVDDPEHFWSNENLILFKRIEQKKWILWVRCPFDKAQNFDFLNELNKKIQGFLKKRLPPLSKGTLSPLSFVNSYTQNGTNKITKPPLHWPIYETSQKTPVSKNKNMKIVNYHTLPHMEWGQLILENQKKVEEIYKLLQTQKVRN